MKYKFLTPSAAVLFSLVTVSCSTTGSVKVGKAPPPAAVSVAVKQFTSEKYYKLSEEEKGVRDFEHIYLAGKLVDRLKVTPGCEGAYFSMGDTAATDVVVTGQVVESDGKELQVKVTSTRVDGKATLSKTFTLDHETGDPPTITAKLGGFIDTMAAEIVRDARRSKISLPQARTLAYAQNPNAAMTDKNIENAQFAAKVERSDILTPLTNALIPRARIAEGPYIEWQSVSTPLVIERKAAIRTRNLANIQMGLAGVAAGASSFSSGYSGTPDYGTQMRMRTMMVEAGETANAASNKAKKIEGTLAAFKSTFAVGQNRQLTIRIYDKIIQLNGTQAEQLEEFREIVKEKLNESPAVVASN